MVVAEEVSLVVGVLVIDVVPVVVCETVAVVVRLVVGVVISQLSNVESRKDSTTLFRTSTVPSQFST